MMKTISVQRATVPKTLMASVTSLGSVTFWPVVVMSDLTLDVEALSAVAAQSKAGCVQVRPPLWGV